MLRSRAIATEESAESRLFPQLVESEIEFEDVDARFAEQAQLARGDVLLDELANALFAQVAGLGDAGSLEVGGVGGDVGIESGGGGGDQIDGHRLAGILLRPACR